MHIINTVDSLYCIDDVVQWLKQRLLHWNYIIALCIYLFLIINKHLNGRAGGWHNLRRGSFVMMTFGSSSLMSSYIIINTHNLIVPVTKISPKVSKINDHAIKLIPENSQYNFKIHYPYGPNLALHM